MSSLLSSSNVPIIITFLFERVKLNDMFCFIVYLFEFCLPLEIKSLI